MYDFIVQGIGFVAIAIVIVSYQVFNDKNFYFLNGIMYILMTVHFAMLGAFTATSQNIILVIRNFGFLKGYHNTAIYGSLFAFVLFGAFTVETIIDTLPIISNIACSLVMIFCTGIAVRLVYFPVVFYGLYMRLNMHLMPVLSIRALSWSRPRSALCACCTARD